MRTAPLWTFVDVRPSNVNKKSKQGERSVRLVNYTDVYHHQNITADLDLMLATASNEHIERFRVLPGDIIITKDSESPDDIGIPAQVTSADHDMVCAYHLTLLRPHRNTVCSRFIYWALESSSVKDYWLTSSFGVTRFSIGSGVISRLPVVDVDFETQLVIADYLDRETGEIDAMITKLDDLTDALTARRHAKIASVLASMSVRIRLTLVVDIISGSGFPDRFQGVSGQELPFYKVSSLSLADKGYLREADNSVSRNVAAEVGARIIPPGSVIMAKIGAALLLARYAVTSRPACIDNNLQALVPRSKLIDSRFLAYAMEEVSISSLVKPGPVPSLDVMGIRMTDIAYDNSLEEQHRIVDHLDEVTRKIDAMIAKVSELKSLLIERRAALITDVVTGRKKVA